MIPCKSTTTIDEGGAVRAGVRATRLAVSTQDDEDKAMPLTRRFDATVGAITAKAPIDDKDTEDLELTGFLTRAWLELVNRRPNPVPACPRCECTRIRPENPRRAEQLPTFFCHGCKRQFNRLTGTPFTQLANRSAGAAMIPLLSRQMSLQQAGLRLGRTQKAVLSWLLAFRRWLLELDPSGRWEARVRLGVRVAPHATCVRCGFEGGFQSGGFDPQGRRRIRCPNCGRSRLLDALQKEGQARDAVIVQDAIDTALRVKRQTFPETSIPHIARAASLRDAAPKVGERHMPRLDTIELPERRRARSRTARIEDAELTAFLLPRVETALGDSREPAACPWCGNAHTEYHAAPRPSGLPGFRCRACLAYFTRVSNTPLTTPVVRSLAHCLIPMLGWREHNQPAADELGIRPQTLQAWIRAWRQWLLLLDPSGAMEARLLLGIRTAKTDVSDSGPMLRGRPRKSDRRKFQERIRRNDASDIGSGTAREAAAWVPESPHTEGSLPANGWLNWASMRESKRRRWTSRTWRKASDGSSFLRADGFLTRVVSTATAWRFEISAVGEEHILRSGDGFRNGEAARLAAFDAITGLLMAPTYSAGNRASFMGRAGSQMNSMI